MDSKKSERRTQHFFLYNEGHQLRQNPDPGGSRIPSHVSDHPPRAGCQAAQGFQETQQTQDAPVLPASPTALYCRFAGPHDP